jgi:hypothetical protein
MAMPNHEQDDRNAHYRNGTMTRAGMVDRIQRGGSVIHKGVLYGKVEDLPSETAMAEGDSAAAEALNRSLEDQIASLTRQKVVAEETRSRAAAADAAKAKAEADKPTFANPPTPTPPPKK